MLPAAQHRARTTRPSTWRWTRSTARSTSRTGPRATSTSTTPTAPTCARSRPRWSATGSSPWASPSTRTGNLYVTDLGAAPPTSSSSTGPRAVVRELGAADGLDFPNGVAVDGNGYVYVTDSNNGRLLVFDANGVLQARVGRGAGAGNLGLPRGVARRRQRPRVRDRHERPGGLRLQAGSSPARPASTSSGRSGRRASPTANSYIPTASRSTARDACSLPTRRTAGSRSGTTRGNQEEVPSSPITQPPSGGQPNPNASTGERRKDSEALRTAARSRLALAVPCRSSCLRGRWTPRRIGELRRHSLTADGCAGCHRAHTARARRSSSAGFRGGRCA